MTDTLSMIIHTLNKIEVHGKQNLDMLLGCITVLENMLSEINSEEVNKNG